MIAELPIFDILLVAMLVWLVWRTLSTPDRFQAVVLYITFGVIMAVSWVRLEAVNLALVEAAIGAGLTGVLLLDALGRIELMEKRDEESNQAEER